VNQQTKAPERIQLPGRYAFQLIGKVYVLLDPDGREVAWPWSQEHTLAFSAAMNEPTLLDKVVNLQGQLRYYQGELETTEVALDQFGGRFWRTDMENAPRDGTPILLRIDGSAIEGSYSNHLSMWAVVSMASHGCGCCAENNEEPTAWMHLPLAPASEAEGR
jgi:hypothetical protein